MRNFLTVVRRRVWLVVAAFLLCVLGSGILTALSTPTYRSTAGLYFSVRTANSVNDLAAGATFSQSQMASFATLATTPRVLQPVADELGIEGGAATLEGQVAVTPLAGTVVLDLTVTDTDAKRAAEIANAAAQQVITVVEDLSPTNSEGGASAIEVSVVTPAAPPQKAAKPDVALNLGAGAVLGLGLGILLALGREALDTRVRSAAEVVSLTRTPVIGTLGSEPARRSGVVMATAPHSPQAEAYRQLRTNLHFVDVGGRGHGGTGARQVIAVSSSVAGEGKSTVAANLAIALAETGARVLLVDADLRRPSLAGVLGLEGAAGLTTVLLGQARVQEVVQDWGSVGLHVLASGPLPPNPTELLGSVPFRALLRDLRGVYDHVIVDSAPLLPVADAAVLSGLVDGTLLLVNVTKVRRHQLAESLGTLAQVDAPLLGVVLNQVARDERSYGYAQQPSAAPVPPRADRPVAPGAAGTPRGPAVVRTGG
jgi:capsular exopolysaccharide synthesis family protein